MTHLQDLSVLVTGASQGIGEAIARYLAEQGARVGLAARSTDRLDAIVAELTSAGHSALAITCDVTDYASVEAAVSAQVERFERLDALVNNAGTIEPIARITDADPGAWARAMTINATGTFHGVRAAALAMPDGGTIVNMSSGAANSALEGWSHYCSSKAAAKKITECAHRELSGAGLRVVGLSPGTVATPMMAKIRDSGINPVSQLDWSAHIPPEWVGRAVAYLLGSEGARHAGTDFSIKTPEGRAAVGLPQRGAPDR